MIYFLNYSRFWNISLIEIQKFLPGKLQCDSLDPKTGNSKYNQGIILHSLVNDNEYLLKPRYNEPRFSEFHDIVN